MKPKYISLIHKNYDIAETRSFYLYNDVGKYSPLSATLLATLIYKCSCNLISLLNLNLASFSIYQHF